MAETGPGPPEVLLLEMIGQTTCDNPLEIKVVVQSFEELPTVLYRTDPYSSLSAFGVHYTK